MKDLVLTLIEGQQKAVVGGAVTGILVLLAQVGIDGDMTVKTALIAAASWLVSHVFVWITKNK